ncbi:MAG: flagellar motor protein MotB [Vicinamibacterales bacterium]
MKPDQIIIVKKKGHGRHGHHGGAWKVAYADFVTAMMAFFLVMWIVAQSAATRAAVASYFRDPGVFDTTAQQGVLSGDARGANVEDMPVQVEQARSILEQAAVELRKALERMPEFAALKDNVEIQLTAEGLRIELLETERDGFFEVGSSRLKPESIALLTVIAGQIGKLSNKVAIEGHTDSRPYHSADVFSNWELSSDRANGARREMQLHGLSPGQVEAVRGYADTRLRFADTPLDARNRRISILVRRQDRFDPAEPLAPAPGQ